VAVVEKLKLKVKSAAKALSEKKGRQQVLAYGFRFSLFA